jgi:hypothetical protein
MCKMATPGSHQCSKIVSTNGIQCCPQMGSINGTDCHTIQGSNNRSWLIRTDRHGQPMYCTRYELPIVIGHSLLCVIFLLQYSIGGPWTDGSQSAAKFMLVHKFQSVSYYIYMFIYFNTPVKLQPYNWQFSFHFLLVTKWFVYFLHRASLGKSIMIPFLSDL